MARRLLGAMALASLCLALGGLQAGQAEQSAVRTTHPTVVFMTDYGTDNDAVPICKGVIYGIDPEIRIVDLTHQVTPYSILEAARYLAGTTPYYPAGTVFEVVVDPGVGSKRKAIVVKSKREQYFVLPDNGLMTLVQDQDGLESAREITNPGWMIGQKLSSDADARSSTALSGKRPQASTFSSVEFHTVFSPRCKAMLPSQEVRAASNPASIPAFGVLRDRTQSRKFATCSIVPSCSERT